MYKNIFFLSFLGFLATTQLAVAQDQVNISSIYKLPAGRNLGFSEDGTQFAFQEFNQDKVQIRESKTGNIQSLLQIEPTGILPNTKHIQALRTFPYFHQALFSPGNNWVLLRGEGAQLFLLSKGTLSEKPEKPVKLIPSTDQKIIPIKAQVLYISKFTDGGYPVAHRVREAAFSEDEHWLAYMTTEGQVVLYDLQTQLPSTLPIGSAVIKPADTNIGQNGPSREWYFGMNRIWFSKGEPTLYVLTDSLIQKYDIQQKQFVQKLSTNLFQKNQAITAESLETGKLQNLSFAFLMKNASTNAEDVLFSLNYLRDIKISADGKQLALLYSVGDWQHPSLIIRLISLDAKQQAQEKLILSPLFYDMTFSQDSQQLTVVGNTFTCQYQGPVWKRTFFTKHAKMQEENPMISNPHGDAFLYQKANGELFLFERNDAILWHFERGMWKKILNQHNPLSANKTHHYFNGIHPNLELFGVSDLGLGVDEIFSIKSTHP